MTDMTDMVREIREIHKRLAGHARSLCPDAPRHIHADALRDIALRLANKLYEIEAEVNMHEENARLKAEVAYVTDRCRSGRCNPS